VVAVGTASIVVDRMPHLDGVAAAAGATSFVPDQTRQPGGAVAAAGVESNAKDRTLPAANLAGIASTLADRKPPLDEEPHLGGAVAADSSQPRIQEHVGAGAGSFVVGRMPLLSGVAVVAADIVPSGTGRAFPITGALFV
jgi:hypothetical protein